MKNVFKAALFMLVLVLSAAFVSANPVVNPISDQSVNEGSPLRVSLSSVASNNALANFSVCQTTAQPGICSGEYNNESITVGTTVLNISTLSATTGEINWTPDFTQSGTYFFNVTANASEFGSSKAFKVTVVNVPPKLTATAALTLGGKNQVRSNPNHDTENKREINITGAVTISNDGAAPEALNNLKGTVTVASASGFAEDDVRINFTLPQATLAVGESISMPVTVRVPQKLNAVTSALVAAAVNVGSIKFEATPAVSEGTVSGTTQIDVRAENNLELKDVKIRFDGKSEDVSNDDRVSNLKPGMTVVFEIMVENNFGDSEDVVIENVDVKVVSNGELNIDESESIGDLGPQDVDTVRFESFIDEDTDDGTFSVEISAEGFDEFGARHGEKITVDFAIRRENHEIEIKSLVLNPPTVSCEKETSLTASIRNSGRRNEQDVFVNVASPELRFGARSDRLELDKDDEETVSFNIPVPADVARPANYRLTVDTYYSTGTKSKSDAAILTLARCGPAEEEEEPPAEEPPVTPPPSEEPKQPPATTPPAPAKKPFTETPQYLALLALGYVAVLGGGGLLLYKLIRKP